MSHRLRRLFATDGPSGPGATGFLSTWRPLLRFWLFLLAIVAVSGTVLGHLGSPAQRPTREQMPAEPPRSVRQTGDEPLAATPSAAPLPGHQGSAGPVPPPDGSTQDGQAVQALASSGAMPDSNDEASGPTRGRRLVVLHPSSSKSGRAAAQQLAVRVGLANGQTATEVTANTPPRATVRFYSVDDHALARRLGQELTQLGYAWQIENLSARPSPSGRQPVEVWLPNR